MPGLAAVLDWRAAKGCTQPTTLHVEVSDGAVLTAYELGEVTIHDRDGHAPGEVVSRAIAAEDVGDLGYAWLCGEAAMATGLRRHLVKERGIDRRRILFSGFWKLGEARG